jgi:hypothetical protein
MRRSSNKRRPVSKRGAASKPLLTLYLDARCSLSLMVQLTVGELVRRAHVNRETVRYYERRRYRARRARPLDTGSFPMSPEAAQVHKASEGTGLLVERDQRLIDAAGELPSAPAKIADISRSFLSQPAT